MDYPKGFGFGHTVHRNQETDRKKEFSGCNMICCLQLNIGNVSDLKLPGILVVRQI